MPTYISLLKHTHQGISTIKEGPNSLDANKEILSRYGSELKAFYLTRRWPKPGPRLSSAKNEPSSIHGSGGGVGGDRFYSD
jgi:hypothetical protein